MFIRMTFCEISEVKEDIHYIDEIISGSITKEEVQIQIQNVLNILGIDSGDIEICTIEKYWKIEESYDVNICCKGDKFPDDEKLLKIADIWDKNYSNILSSWSIPENKMRFKLIFINISN